MSDSFKYAQLQPFSLYGAGATIGDTSLVVSSMLDIDGNAITMSGAFGSKGFGTIDPGNSNLEEQVCWTGLTNNSNGTTTLTGVSSVTFLYPYTETSGLLKTHSGSAPFVVSNTSGFYDELTSKDDDETVNGIWTFTQLPVSSVAPTGNTQLVNKLYADGLAIAGSPDSSTVTKGIGKVSVSPASPTSPIFVGDNDPRVPTQGENDALVGNNTSIAVGTGNKFVTQTGLQNMAESYVTTTGSANAYVATYSPVPTALAAGQEFSAKASFANTGAATFNPNSLGATAIRKGDGTVPLVAGDIASGLIIKLKYDGSVFQLISPTANTPAAAPAYKSGTTSKAASTSQTIAHGLGKVPSYARLTTNWISGATGFAQSFGTYNGTTTASIYSSLNGAANVDNSNVANIVGNITVNATITYDATNLNLTWNTASIPTNNVAIVWEAYA